MTAPPRCKVCLSNLLPDGTCRYKCPPELKRSAVTAKVTAAKRRAERERIKAESTFITDADRKKSSEAVAGFDPIAAHMRQKSQRASRKRWR